MSFHSRGKSKTSRTRQEVREENDLTPVIWHHCILHQESLATKSLDKSNVTRVVISTVNWIQANALTIVSSKSFLLMLMLTMLTWSYSLQYDG